MKLAELLIERSECQNKLIEIKSQILANLKYQEGDKPLVDINNLRKQFEEANAYLESLIIKINQANHKFKLNNNMTIAEAIAHRDAIKAKIDFNKDIIKSANTKDYRITRTEIKMILTVDINVLLNEIDSLSKEFRLLDNSIQQVNWITEV